MIINCKCIDYDGYGRTKSNIRFDSASVESVTKDSLPIYRNKEVRVLFILRRHVIVVDGHEDVYVTRFSSGAVLLLDIDATLNQSHDK